MQHHTLSSLIWTRLVRLNQVCQSLSNEFLLTYGLTAAQFDVLAQIYIHQPLTQIDLADKILVTQGGISRMLSRLELEGYIVKKQEWKTKTVTLSEKGQQLMLEVFPAQLAFQSSVFDKALDKQELNTLYDLLTKVHKHNKNK